ncbi:MAG: CAP domain-containing protein [Botrimarina sp.]
MTASLAVAQSRDTSEVETLTAPPAPLPEVRAEPAEVVDRVVRQTNELRRSEGLEELATDDRLAEAAQRFADYMARTDRYGHQADGQRAAQRVREEGYDYCLVLENIGYGFDPDGYSSGELTSTFFDGWKNSPGHRENMLDPAVTETVVAVARSDKTAHWYAVQLFGRPKSAAIEFRVENDSEAEVSYTVGENAFDLPPRYAREHLRCRPVDLVFDLGGDDSAERTLEAEAGASYVISGEGQGGGLRVEASAPEATRGD